MKTAPLMLVLLAAPALLSAQATTAPSAPAGEEKPQLTDAQVSNVLSQLQELEKTISAQRSGFLGGIIAKLDAATASEAAATNFYLDCYSLINAERKDGSKVMAREMEQRMEKSMEKRAKAQGGTIDDEGDQACAIRLGLRYLMLTLQANECTPETLPTMVPKLQEYVKNLVDSATKLRGRARNMIRSAQAPVVEAYQLQRYLAASSAWSGDPSSLGGMYGTMLKIAESTGSNPVPLWDSRIAAEQAFAKGQLSDAEFELWVRNDLPALRWARASYLYSHGAGRIQAMADMLSIIKEYPGHADAPKWVDELRKLVNESAPAQATSGGSN